MNEFKILYVILYAIIMVCISVRVVIKKKHITYCFLWIANAVSAVFCVLCKVFHRTLVGNGFMQSLWYDLSDTTFWGYLLIVLCCYIAFRPFEFFDSKESLSNFGNNSSKKRFFVLFSYAFIFCAVVFILLSLNTVLGLLNISDYGVVRLALFDNADNESTFIMTNNFFANICYKLCLQFKYLNVFISLLMLKEKYRPRLAFVSLFFNFLVFYLYATGNAARGGLLIFFFVSSLIGLSMIKYMTKNVKRKIYIFGAVVVSVVFVFFMAVTISRFGSDGGGGNPILRNISFYLGHGPIEFSKITGSLEHFAYGKVLIGRMLNNYFGTPYSWENLQQQIGYPPIGAVFTTYLGYLYTDFGAFGCILFVSIWSWFMKHLVVKSPNRVSTMFLFFYYLNYFVTGVFAIGRLEYVGMVTAHIIFFFIRLAEDILKHRSSKYVSDDLISDYIGENNAWNND